MELEFAEQKQVEEFVSTEKTYVKNLNTILNKFKKPLEERLEEDDVKIIFQNIEMLCSLHKMLLSKFLTVLANSTNNRTRTSEFVKVFQKYIGGLGIYSQYCGGLPLAQKRLDELENEFWGKNRFNTKLEEIQSKNRITLDSLLINPLQRITRYELLFGVLIKGKDKAFAMQQAEYDTANAAFDQRRMLYMKETRDREKEFQNQRLVFLQTSRRHREEQRQLDKIRNTISNLKDITQKANARKTEEEQRLRVMELCDVIKDCPIDISLPPSRRCCGEKEVVPDKLKMYLFNDIVLWTKDTGLLRDYHKYEGHIKLAEIENAEVRNGRFHISGSGKSLNFEIPATGSPTLTVHNDAEEEWKDWGKKILDTALGYTNLQEESKRNGENELKRLRRKFSFNPRRAKGKLKMSLKIYHDDDCFEYPIMRFKSVQTVLEDISKLIGDIDSNPYVIRDEIEDTLCLRQVDITFSKQMSTNTM